ncbi:hypothetical protein [Pedobacter zeae]|uniref:Glycosyltransferase RgtA/B/C/D-like domain-containing protein n=2 Tax=Pedobacter zeae TaxID=1737356 RepID=A0A7W6P390_9SPHI|nr:hypothetical protein [Pedobacter zeae]MBB4106249.1 hypothetical protein [Pedobacter zeae]
MIAKSNKFLCLLSFLLFGYYIYIAYLLYSGGVHSNEALFFTEKSALLHEGDADGIKLGGLTFPQLPFIFSWVFSFLSIRFSPVLASALGSSALFFIITASIKAHQYRNWLFLGILITFMLHPAFIFFAVSGKSSYMVLIFFYLFVMSIFRFFRTNTSYHISVASIYFTLLIFCSFKFSWLMLFILPIIFFVALQSMTVAKNDPLDKIAIAFNTQSIRRKLVNKTLAVYLIIFALPITAILIFRLLNQTYTGDADYYLNSPYANYSAITDQTDHLNNLADSKLERIFPEVHFLVTVRILMFAPLLLLCLGIFKSINRNIFMVFSLFFFIEFLKIKYPSVYIPVHFYAAFICLCWALIANAKSIRTLRFGKHFYLSIIILQLVTAYLTMNSSHLPEEKKYQDALVSLITQKPLERDDNEILSDCIRRINSHDGILTDDANAYQIIALTGSAKIFLTPEENSFLAALAQPVNHVSYILATKKESPYDSFGLLNASTIQTLRSKGVSLHPVCSNKNWILWRIKNGKK